jgi:hypothetical protein
LEVIHFRVGEEANSNTQRTSSTSESAWRKINGNNRRGAGQKSSVMRREAIMRVGIHMDLALPRAKPFLDADMKFMLHTADISKMRAIMGGSDLKMLRSGLGDSYTRDVAAIADHASCI